jgi:hypothetical protein
MFETVFVLNPGAPTVIEYVPGIRFVIAKRPSLVVTKFDVATPVASFFAVTVAPGTAAPLGSVTNPTILPVVACPKTLTPAENKIIDKIERPNISLRRDCFISILLNL